MIVSLNRPTFPKIYIQGARFNEFVKMFNTKPDVFNNVILSGLTFYGYNELATMTLTKVRSMLYIDFEIF